MASRSPFEFELFQGAANVGYSITTGFEAHLRTRRLTVLGSYTYSSQPTTAAAFARWAQTR